MTEEDLLLERARESLRAARIMAEEGLPNISASRGYYVMFYIAEALLLRRGLSFSSHSAVIAAFGIEFSRSKDLDPKFHRYLIASQNTRQVGDYGIEKSVIVEEAEQIIERAEEFMSSAVLYLGLISS